jgi:two-component system sensor kinase FixL
METSTKTQNSQEDAQARLEQFRCELGPFVTAAETTTMAMVFTDAESARNPLVFVNNSFLALTGFRREDVLGKDLSFILGHLADKVARSSIEIGIETAAAGTWEAPCRRADGSEFLSSVFVSPVRDKAGIVRQNFLSFVEVVAERDRGLAGRDELCALYEKAPGFIATTEGAKHCFTFANESYRRLVGRDNLVGKKVADALPEIVEQGFVELLDHVYETGRPFVARALPTSIRQAPGGEIALRYLDFVYQPVRNGNDQITGLFCEGFDVTAEKLARDQILTLQTELIHVSRVSAMETMATTLAHELNQPLTAITSYVAGFQRLIDAGEVSTGRLIDVLNAVAESSERAGNIVRHLREMTRSGVPSRERFDLSEAIAECLPLLQTGDCEGVQVIDECVQPITLEADRIQTQQVILNLLRNACEATHDAESQLVSIKTSSGEQFATIWVSDSGTGVPSGLAEAGFSWTQSSKATGMGVGLSISRTIVEAHGGKLWLERSGADGSCFAFSMPIAKDVEKNRSFLLASPTN